MKITLIMIRSLTNVLKWLNPEPHDEWSTWTNWQRFQAISHYESSEIFQYYLSYRPNFNPPLNSCIEDTETGKYLIYCFGDFASLLVVSGEEKNIIEYITIILDVYDICRGMIRRITGDPLTISVLREASVKRTIAPLRTHNFFQYMYPYDMIHGHTVAQHSLSTLLMRLVSHYMTFIDAGGSFQHIDYERCKKSYLSHTFGIPVSSPKKPESIDMCPSEKNQFISIDTGRMGSPDNSTQRECGISLHEEGKEYPKCEICKRTTENTWGNFGSCIDCHTKRICSICSKKAVIISDDGLPKCSTHA